MGPAQKTDLDRRFGCVLCRSSILAVARNSETEPGKLAGLCRRNRLSHGDGDGRRSFDHRHQHPGHCGRTDRDCQCPGRPAACKFQDHIDGQECQAGDGPAGCRVEGIRGIVKEVHSASQTQAPSIRTEWRRSLLQFDQRHPTGRMGVDFREQSGQWNRPVERRISDFAGRHERHDQRKSRFSSVRQSRPNQFAGAGRYGDGHGIGGRDHGGRHGGFDGDAESVLALIRPAWHKLCVRDHSEVEEQGSLWRGDLTEILGPTGSSLGYPTMAARAGDSIELYCVGLGPTTPVVPAGKAFIGAAPDSYRPQSLHQ